MKTPFSNHFPMLFPYVPIFSSHVFTPQSRPRFVNKAYRMVFVDGQLHAGESCVILDIIGIYHPLVNIQKTIENCPFIVDLPMKDCDFP
jgi:hypothetical protein